MKHLKSLKESLKGKELNTYNFGSKGFDSQTSKKVGKKEVSGSLLHWRRV
jgi:hypothetical protein